MTAPAPDVRESALGGAALYGRAADGLGLREALADAPLGDAVALLSTPAAFLIATVHEEGRCTTADGDAPLGEVFEARAFTPEVELRWTATGPGTGRAVLLAEDPALLPEVPFDQDVPVLAAPATLEARYLLWGHPVAQDLAPPGWTTLYTARIGTLRVPLPAGTARPSGEERVYLVAREYVCTEPAHGNAYIAEERLLHLESTGPERRGTRHG